MTGDVVFLPDCVALPPLLIRELFGLTPLTWTTEKGVSLSSETVAVELEGVRYFLPVLRNDYLSPRLFLDSANLPGLTGSLYSRFSDQDLTFLGPAGTVKRRGASFSVTPMIWSPSKESEDIKECVAEVTLKTRNQTLIFHSAPVIIASHDRLSLILPEKWKSVTGIPEEITLDFNRILNDDSILTFSRIITENDVRVAKRKNQTIRLESFTRLTPAARDLGKDLKIFR